MVWEVEARLGEIIFCYSSLVKNLTMHGIIHRKSSDEESAMEGIWELRILQWILIELYL